MESKAVFFRGSFGNSPFGMMKFQKTNMQQATSISYQWCRRNLRIRLRPNSLLSRLVSVPQFHGMLCYTVLYMHPQIKDWSCPKWILVSRYGSRNLWSSELATEIRLEKGTQICNCIFFADVSDGGWCLVNRHFQNQKALITCWRPLSKCDIQPYVFCFTCKKMKATRCNNGLFYKHPGSWVHKNRWKPLSFPKELLRSFPKIHPSFRFPVCHLPF